MSKADEIDVRCLPYMPLQVEQLRKSKTWLRCRRRPELGFYLMNLWMRAWHEVPAGSIENDDDVLADAAMCTPEKWEELRGVLLEGWEIRDGRVYHRTVTELATEAFGKLRKNSKRTEAAREAAKKAAEEKRSATSEDAVTDTVTDTVTVPVTDAVTETATDTVTGPEGNLNTLIQMVTLVGMCVGGVAIWVDKSRDIEDLQNWRTGHEQLHKERLAEVSGISARNEERFRGLESEVRKIDNLTYRLTVTEQSTTSTAAAIKDLQSLLSQQAGDLKVVREILQRLEASEQRRR